MKGVCVLFSQTAIISNFKSQPQLLKTIKLKIAKDIKDSVGYVLDSLDKIHSSDDHGFNETEVKRLLKIEKELAESFKPFQENLNKINSTIENGLKAFVETLRIIAEPTFRALFRASEYGWYLSPEAIRKYPISQLAELLKQDDLSELEESILNDADNLAKKTIEKAITIFPDRKDVLLEILDCYNKKYYFATINLSYSQTDGICNELWGFGFFDKTGKPEYKLKAHEEFQNYQDGLATIISQQLSTRSNEVTMHSDTFKNNFTDKIKSSFNRHLVQHGHSVNYGNQTNAIRAILIIDFLMYFKNIRDKNCL